MTGIILPNLGDTEVLGYDRMQQFWQAVKDLADPPSAIYDRPSTDPTLTTSSASFGLIDGTAGKYNLTITTRGNPVLVHFEATLIHNTAAAYGYLDLEVDGVLTVGVGTIGLSIFNYVNTAAYWAAQINRMVTGLSAGSHTFKMYWRTSAGILSLIPNSKSQFSVREL